MTTDNEIKTAISTQFPITFDNQPAVPLAAFFKAYNSLVEYAVKATTPQLEQETSKYQWTLLSSSLLLLAIALLNIKKIEINKTSINVDQAVLLWYMFFVIAVLLIFLARAALDLKRASLARRKDPQLTSEVKEVVNIGLNKRLLELYYWQELSHQIGEKYTLYEDVQSSNYNFPHRFQNIDVRLVKIDLDKMRKLEEYRASIESHEIFLKDMLGRLDKDAGEFTSGVNKYDYLNSPRRSGQSEGKMDRAAAVSALSDTHLHSWFEVRRDLAAEQLKNQADEMNKLPEQLMLEEQLEVLRQTIKIRRLYVFLEIGIPIIFTCSVLVYVFCTMPS